MDIEPSERETGELSYPRDLLRRFSGGRRGEKLQLELEEASSPELSLGLSLGGCFAVEPREPRLPRSSSITALSVFQNERKFAVAASTPLVRACSLPAEAEEENRKRKEMQGLKRLEAKRKRLEKIRSGSEISGLSNAATIPSMHDTGNRPGAAAPLPPRLRSLKSLQEDDEALKRLTSGLNGSKDLGRDMMTEMPCVSTKGDGPSGRRIEGFLYKYRKGEEVRIVCVCHGSFLSPAEFVKHAGGGDVAYPLRHIVVIPSPAVYY